MGDWRTEPGTGGNAAGMAIIGQVTLAGAAGRNARPCNAISTARLPASHIIDVKFDIPPDSPTRGILDVVGIMMKPNEEVSGQQLASTRVKVSRTSS